MKRHLVSSILASIIGLATVAACGGGSKSSGTTQPRTVGTDDPSCPVTVPGTSVTVEDTDTGAALVFVSTGDVGEVRKRVATMAKMHNDHHGSMGALPDGKDAGGGHAGHDMGGGSAAGGHAGHDMGSAQGHEGHDMSKHAGHAGGMIGVHSKADAVDVEGGARLVLTAGAADVAKLQSELRMHAQHLSGGTCAMGSS
jgi:hypothetical protein